MSEYIDWLSSNHGVVTGILSAFAFLFVTFVLFRPWILVGSHISEIDDGFKFKMINITPFKCVDFKIFLRQVVVKDLERGNDLEFEILEDKENPFIYIPSIFSGVLSSRPNCMQLYTDKDVKEIIKADGTYVEIVVSARHSLSGLQSIRRKKFKHIDCIEPGKFKRGFSFKIKR